MCGQRQPILEFLKYARALPAATSTGEQKPCWSDAPGMYGLTVSRRHDGIDKSGGPLVMRTLYIVLWPRDNQDVGNHPKSLTSTLIRYLTQLCSKASIFLQKVQVALPSDIEEHAEDKKSSTTACRLYTYSRHNHSTGNWMPRISTSHPYRCVPQFGLF